MILGFNLLFAWMVYTSDLQIPRQPAEDAGISEIIIVPCECPDGIPAYID